MPKCCKKEGGVEENMARGPQTPKRLCKEGKKKNQCIQGRQEAAILVEKVKTAFLRYTKAKNKASLGL